MSRMMRVERERPTTVTILVDRELRARLERVAGENERSLGGEVRHMLREHLERAERQEEG